jgi:LmbE family N-acetylglucosaminyl deacetylase
MTAVRFLILLFVLAISVCGKSDKVDYSRFRNAQDFTVPVLDLNEENKTALFIFPHDDDVICCAGTSQFLREKNWLIYALTLTEDAAPKEAAKRSVEWNTSMKYLGFTEATHLFLPNNPWTNVEKNELVFWNEKTDSLETLIYKFILKYRPSVVFTFDTTVGGYGHPEHRLTGKAVYRVFQAHKYEAGFPLKRILHSTMPEKLEQVWLANNPAYLLTQKYAGPVTLPEPNAAIDVRKYWPLKREAAAAYKTQKATLKKFMMLPDKKDTAAHYQAFAREYYLEVK